MMPTDFDKALDQYLGMQERPPTGPETCGLGVLDRVATDEPSREAPPGSLVSLRLGAPRFAEAVARLLGLPLAHFSEAGQMLEVTIPWWSEPLWFVGNEMATQTLVGEGVSRGRIWTATELLDLLSIPGLTRASVRTVALAKLEFDADVI